MHFATEILFFSFLGLLLFGPTKMAEIARQVGAFVAQFKRVTADFQTQITNELQLAEAQKSARALPFRQRETVQPRSGDVAKAPAPGASS